MLAAVRIIHQLNISQKTEQDADSLMCSRMGADKRTNARLIDRVREAIRSRHRGRGSEVHQQRRAEAGVDCDHDPEVFGRVLPADGSAGGPRLGVDVAGHHGVDRVEGDENAEELEQA